MKGTPKIRHLVFIIFVFLLVAGAAREQTGETSKPSRAGSGKLSFSKLAAKVEIESNAIEVKAFFTLGEQSSGINPLSQDVSFKVGNFSAVIPAGSFTKNSSGWFKYKGTIHSIHLKIKIFALDANQYVFWARAAVKDQPVPVSGYSEVEISIDDNNGGTTARVKRS